MIGDVHRKADGSALLRESARDRLLDPPRRIRGELEAHLVVELLDRTNEPEVAFLDEVEEGDIRTRVVARDRHDEPKVRLDQLALRGLVPGILAAGELALLRRREQATVADLTHVELQGVVRARAGEPGELARCRRLVNDGRMLLVRRVEEMLGGKAFHGGSYRRHSCPA